MTKAAETASGTVRNSSGAADAAAAAGGGRRMTVEAAPAPMEPWNEMNKASKLPFDFKFQKKKFNFKDLCAESRFSSWRCLI